MNAPAPTDIERITLLRGAIPEDPFFGCCDSSCYACNIHPSHYDWCEFAALTDRDRSADPAQMDAATAGEVRSRLEAAVPAEPTFGMCYTACMLCYEGDPDHRDDCGWKIAQRAGVLPVED